MTWILLALTASNTIAIVWIMHTGALEILNREEKDDKNPHG